GAQHLGYGIEKASPGTHGGGEGHREPGAEHACPERPQQITGYRLRLEREVPHGRETEARRGDVHAVTDERRDDRWQQRLVILESAAVQDLEGEERRADGRPEQYRECRRYARD